MGEFLSLSCRIFIEKSCENSKRKFDAFLAIIRLNNRGNFVKFSAAKRKFAISNVLSLVRMRNFTTDIRAEVQRIEQSWHVSDPIDHSCNLDEIYFDNWCVNCVLKLAVLYLSIIDQEGIITHYCHKVSFIFCIQIR